MQPGRMPPSTSPLGGQEPGAGRRPTLRETALDRIQEARVVIAGRSQWIKRGAVLGVSALLGVGALQDSVLLGWLAFPVGLAMWWLDAQLTREEWKLDLLYNGVFQGNVSPPEFGEVTAAAAEMKEDDQVLRRALLSGPGVGIHFMMLGIAVLFNLVL